MQATAYRPAKGQFKCLELATGKVCWSTARVGHASAIVADGKLIMLNDEGVLVLARATPDAYTELGRAPILGGRICWTSPSLSHGRLFVRDTAYAACVYLGSPDSVGPKLRRLAKHASEIRTGKMVDLSWMLGVEQDFPFASPTFGMLALWFGCCMAIYALSVIVAAGASLAMAARWRARTAWSVFACAAFALGAAGTPVLGPWLGTFTFTWPTCLFVAFAATLTALAWAERQPASTRTHRATWAAVLAFLGLCVGYFLLCRALSIVTTWGFLFGFLPAFPVTVVGVRALIRARSVRVWGAWLAAAFALYFWSSGVFTICRMHMGG
jgi:hypothetical protein